MKRVLLGCAMFFLLALIAGCASKVQYGDAGSAKPLSVEFGSSDLQQIAETMVDSLLTFPADCRDDSATAPGHHRR